MNMRGIETTYRNERVVYAGETETVNQIEEQQRLGKGDCTVREELL